MKCVWGIHLCFPFAVNAEFIYKDISRIFSQTAGGVLCHTRNAARRFSSAASKFYAALKNMMSLTIYNRHRTPEIPILRRLPETAAFIQMQGVLVFRLHTQGHFSLLICRFFHRFPQQPVLPAPFPGNPPPHIIRISWPVPRWYPHSSSLCIFPASL